jgi:diguanylate cyclase (GGDEF)-like protein
MSWRVWFNTFVRGLTILTSEMVEGHPPRQKLYRLRRHVVASSVVLIAVLHVFRFAMVRVSALECLIEWGVVTGLALGLVYFSFRVVLKQQDLVERQARQLASELAARKRSQETIKRLAYHDDLTGLPNRVFFNERLDVALARASWNGDNLAVMLMDLDHFKNVNDTLGHTMGDRLLQRVGVRLKDTLRKGDTVCRMGGDEFLLLLPGLGNSREAGIVARKILAAIREPFLVDDVELSITTSLGVALCPDDGRDRDTLVSNADIAMYYVKANGRDGYQVHADIRQSEVAS